MRAYVTVVSGLPRSGTSLMMQMLETGGMPILTDGLRPPDDDNSRGYFEYEPVKRTKHDASWVARALGKAVKVVYILLPDLPPDREYRVILMRRDPREVIASQQAMLTRTGREGGNVTPEMFETELCSITEWLQQQPNFRVIQIDYRECIDNPPTVASRLSGFLNGLDIARMASAADPALYRARSARIVESECRSKSTCD